MNTRPHRFELTLEHRALLSVADAADLQIDCREGTVWVTLDHDPRDVVLATGERFVTAEHRRAVIYALEPARIAVQRATVQPVASTVRSGWLRRLLGSGTAPVSASTPGLVFAQSAA